ncbi:hypothetical protein FDZ71_17425, partial [bacterium]
MGKFLTYPTENRDGKMLSFIVGIICLIPATLGMLAGTLGWLPHDPMQFIAEGNAGPSSSLLLGADALGRDLFSRLGAAAAYFTPPGALAMGV